MPELPEVETIVSQLKKRLVGKVWQGKKIKNVRRRAKLIIVEFTDKTNLVFHLKLTGQLIFNGQPSAHTRKVFYFKDGSRLIFNNMRKFGWWKLVKDMKEIEDKLGPEPFEISFKQFKARLKKRPRSKIKLLLMDQKFIAGIGNIYADETLFLAGVRPARLVGSLSNLEIKKIFDKMIYVLKKAIKARGSSNQHYLDAQGNKGEFVKQQKVYRRAGQPCLKCKTPIKRIKLGSRSTHFCPHCQQ
jgi:formamidopyrimidine-DNA glycosylase